MTRHAMLVALAAALSAILATGGCSLRPVRACRISPQPGTGPITVSRIHLERGGHRPGGLFARTEWGPRHEVVLESPRLTDSRILTWAGVSRFSGAAEGTREIPSRAGPVRQDAIWWPSDDGRHIPSEIGRWKSYPDVIAPWPPKSSR